jgi:hypothetical protein
MTSHGSVRFLQAILSILLLTCVCGVGIYCKYSGANLYDDREDAPAVATSSVIENPYYANRNVSLPTPSAEDRIRDLAGISYHGVSFTTTHKEFLRMYPYAKPAAPILPGGVASYAIDDMDGERDAVWFQFLGEEFLCLGFAYDGYHVQRRGGESALLERAIRRFGPPAEKDQKVTLWRYPTIDRSIRAGWSGENWCLLITRDSLKTELNRRQSSRRAQQAVFKATERSDGEPAEISREEH